MEVLAEGAVACGLDFFLKAFDFAEHAVEFLLLLSLGGGDLGLAQREESASLVQVEDDAGEFSEGYLFAEGAGAELVGVERLPFRLLARVGRHPPEVGEDAADEPFALSLAPDPPAGRPLFAALLVEVGGASRAELFDTCRKNPDAALQSLAPNIDGCPSHRSDPDIDP